MSSAIFKVAATCVFVALVLPQYLLPALIVPMRADIAITDLDLGLATGIAFGAAALLSPTVGRRLAARNPFGGAIISVALVAITCVGIALFAAGPVMVILMMVLSGLATAIGSPCIYGMVAGGVPVAQRGLAMGFVSAAPQMAAFLAGLALPTIAIPFDWQIAYVIPVSMGVLALFAIRVSGVETKPSPSSPGVSGDGPGRGVLARVTVAAALVSTGGMGLRSFLIIAAIGVGFSAGQAATLFSVTAMVTILSRIGLGAWVGRGGRDPWVQTAATMVLASGGMVFMVFDSMALFLVGALIAGGLGWTWQTPLSLALAEASPKAPGAAVGSMISGFYIGGVIGPLMVGFLAHQGTFPLAWGLCSVFALAGAVMITWAGRLSQEERKGSRDHRTRSQ